MIVKTPFILDEIITTTRPLKASFLSSERGAEIDRKIRHEFGDLDLLVKQPRTNANGGFQLSAPLYVIALNQFLNSNVHTATLGDMERIRLDKSLDLRNVSVDTSILYFEDNGLNRNLGPNIDLNTLMARAIRSELVRRGIRGPSMINLKDLEIIRDSYIHGFSLKLKRDAQIYRLPVFCNGSDFCFTDTDAGSGLPRASQDNGEREYHSYPTSLAALCLENGRDFTCFPNLNNYCPITRVVLVEED